MTFDEAKAFNRLLAALEACDVVMSTARDHGVGDIMPPAYRDSWVATHKEAIAAIAAAKETTLAPL